MAVPAQPRSGCISARLAPSRSCCNRAASCRPRLIVLRTIRSACSITATSSSLTRLARASPDTPTRKGAKNNEEPYVLLGPSFTMIAAYHKRLAPELLQDLNRTRDESRRWAENEYALALAKGDALTPAERQQIIDGYARYTGLDKKLVDNANLRIDVDQFTHNLLLDQKLRVGRLDGRFTGIDPEGLLDTRYYDPTGSAILPPYTSMFNNYLRTELG